ncbi:MAG TPA: penicillin-binding transpeptidase domain-containing protein [Pyrinomonadaceae bacterium]|nr:penicillin-binding transpeptidase domain-containing protein [Pyrinomonadaceae bacterium]
MTFTNRSPRLLGFAFILSVLLILPFQISAAAKKRLQSNSRAKAKATKTSKHSSARAERGRKLSAKDRRAAKRDERSSARNRRGGKSRTVARLSRKELRRLQAQTAREESAAIKARERRLGRSLTKRERAAEMRKFGGSRRRQLLEARRRAEAARQAAIARQRALDKALRDEVQGMIARDNLAGEDPEVRRVAVNALGNHAGTVVVMDPITGKVYSMVNQEWAARRGFKPCSTIKLVTGVAGLSENVIPASEITETSAGGRWDLNSALARSDNGYFERVGSGVGFDKMIHYAKELGLGEKTGANVPFEFSGRLPEMKPGFQMHRMFSYADGFEVTPLQLGTLVSAMANGGKLLAPQVPNTQDIDAKFKPKVRRKLDIDANVLQRMVPGMIGSVNYGSGRRAYDPLQTVAGKTGTCNGGGGSWVGLFTSYAPLANPRLAVVVVTRGTDAHHHLPAAVAGQIYRDLHNRFGTPTNLQIASTPDDEEKEVGDEEGDDMIADQDAQTADDSTATATPTPTPTHKLVPANAPSNVKRVINPITTPAQKSDAPKSTAPGKGSVKPHQPQPDDRPRRTQDMP